MFDPLTHGKTRYIDRDNIGGFLLPGLRVRQDAALGPCPRVAAAMGRRRFHHRHVRSDIYTNDANYVGQVKYQPSPDWNATMIGMYVSDQEREPRRHEHAQRHRHAHAYDNSVIGLKGQFSGLGFVDIKGALLLQRLQRRRRRLRRHDDTATAASARCRRRSTSDAALLLNLDFNRLFFDGLSLSVQIFDIGSDYVSATSARREADVLLTEGQEGTWQWGRPGLQLRQPRQREFDGRPRLGRLGRRSAAGRVGPRRQRLHRLRRAGGVLGHRLEGHHAGAEVPDRRLAVLRRVQLHRLQHQLAGLRRPRQGRQLRSYPRMEGTHSWGYGGDYALPVLAVPGPPDADPGAEGEVHAGHRPRHRPDGALQVHLRRGQPRHQGEPADRRLRRLPAGGEEPQLDPERRARRLRELRRSPGRLRHLRRQRRLPAQSRPVRRRCCTS